MPDRLDYKGRCPHCRIKPLTYKRNRRYFCHRCDRAFDLESGEMIENWAWTADGARKEFISWNRIHPSKDC